jgi:hypothetical protein
VFSILLPVAIGSRLLPKYRTGNPAGSAGSGHQFEIFIQSAVLFGGEKLLPGITLPVSGDLRNEGGTNEC